ncbi:MAG: homoserine kinase [Alphaproteobacteria bacterium]
MAVYTKVTSSDAEEFLQAYDLGTLESLTGIQQGVENTNYFLNTNKGRYVLTLYEKRVQTEDLPFFIGLMEHLAQKGLPCPLPIRGLDGKVLRHIADRPSIIITFLEGHISNRISTEDCAEVGRSLAKMHQAGADFKLQRDNNLSVKGWENLLNFSKDRTDEIFVGLGQILQQELDYLRNRWPTHLPQGVIHADLFPDNVFFKGPKLCGLIDFYFACNDVLAYDLGICINAWCFENHSAFNITKARALIKGYEEIRPLSAAEKDMLPLLSRGAALRFLLTRLHDWLNQVPDALVKPKDPLEYLTRLQFHQLVSNVSAYGLAA